METLAGCLLGALAFCFGVPKYRAVLRDFCGGAHDVRTEFT